MSDRHWYPKYISRCGLASAAVAALVIESTSVSFSALLIAVATVVKISSRRPETLEELEDLESSDYGDLHLPSQAALPFRQSQDPIGGLIPKSS